MPKITVITPSKRPEGLELVHKSLKRQTFKDYEWIIAGPANVAVLLPQEKYGAIYVIDPPFLPGNYWVVYAAYNEMLRKAQGDLIVSWQDFTYAKPDTLERFWQHFQDEPKTIVGAVGNKYTDDTWTVMTWKDPRERDDQGTYYNCYFNDIELNLSAFPKAAFYSVGGFDEYFDKFSSLCGLDVLARLNMQGGWQFKLDQTIKSYSLEHGRLPDWDAKLPFSGPWQDRLKEYLENPVLDYLRL